MKPKNKQAKFILIFAIAFLLMMLVVLVLIVLTLEQGQTQEKQQNTIDISTVSDRKEAKNITIREIIENSGSKFIGVERSVYINIYADFKNDLYDKNGRSNEKYFNDIIAQIVDLEKSSFYLTDNDKNIKIFVLYDKEKDKYTIKINEIEDFYDETDGETYVDIANTQIVKKTLFAVSNDFYYNLQVHNYSFANTILVTSEREELPNGYYKYPTEHIKAKLGGSKVLNLIFDEDYEEPISTSAVLANTKLEDIEAKFKEPGFGSSREGYLGYRTDSEYTFFYGDEVSIYPYKYEANEYFDEYLTDYCATGDLDKLVSDFTTRWSSYFEFDYDSENQNLKLTFPTRGIAMDIKGNNSRGITIYSNYYLTDTVKELIKQNKITLKPNEDLILITEKNRRESMK